MPMHLMGFALLILASTLRDRCAACCLPTRELTSFASIRRAARSGQTPANATWNRGKRSINLDLKQPDDLDVARRLIASADVVIENFRPGVMDRLGLGAETAMAGNPRLIYCALPGFASDDPGARCGLLKAWWRRHGHIRPWEGKVDRPTTPPFPFPRSTPPFRPR